MHVIKILQGLLTPLIAIITVYIAWQQYYINKRKLNFDLYEKRLAIYIVIKEFLIVVQQKKVTRDELLDFVLEMKKAKFLFEEDINDRIEDIIKKTRESINIYEELEPFENGPETQNEESRSLKSRNGKLRSEFNDLRQNLEDYFLRYLDFKNISTKPKWLYRFEKYFPKKQYKDYQSNL
jgi:hypothetical protein